MSEPDDKIPGIDYSKLQELRQRVQSGHNPEEELSKSPLERVEAVLQKLSDTIVHDPDSRIHLHSNAYREFFEEGIRSLRQWIETIKAGREAARWTVHPSNPYLQTAGEAPLVGFNLNGLNTVDITPILDRLLASFEVEVPPGRKISEVIAERERPHEGSPHQEKHKQWTFGTKIPGVTIHISHEYPLPGRQQPIGLTNVKLAFRQDLINFRE